MEIIKTYEELLMSVTQVPSTHDRLIVTAEIPTLAPAAVFDFWVKPVLLC